MALTWVTRLRRATPLLLLGSRVTWCPVKLTRCTKFTLNNWARSLAVQCRLLGAVGCSRIVVVLLPMLIFFFDMPVRIGRVLPLSLLLGRGRGTIVSLPTIRPSTGLLVPARPRTYSFRGALLDGSLLVVVTVRNRAWNIEATKRLTASRLNTAWLTVCGIRTSMVTNRRLVTNMVLLTPKHVRLVVLWCLNVPCAVGPVHGPALGLICGLLCLN